MERASVPIAVEEILTLIGLTTTWAWAAGPAIPDAKSPTVPLCKSPYKKKPVLHSDRLDRGPLLACLLDASITIHLASHAPAS